jgi:hypothetical protein
MDNIEYKSKRKELFGRRHKLINQQNRIRLKRLVIQRYGGRCEWCHTTDLDVLCIDHVDNSGGKHRKALGFKGSSIYKWLRKHNYPKNFQVLCANCNWLKELERRKEADKSYSKKAAYSRTYREQMKLKVLTHYSPGEIKCSNCGEQNINVLTLYNPEKLEKHKHLMEYIIANNYPEGYRVVCLNCHMKLRKQQN